MKPGTLGSRAHLRIETLPAGTILWRCHLTTRTPLWFGPARKTGPTSRWDAPAGQYRVCYLGASAAAAFAETLLRDPPVLILGQEDLEARSLTQVELIAPFRLVLLRDDGLAYHGATADLSSCPPPYTECRRWGVALHGHPDQPDGISYRCRHDNGEIALAVFDRARSALAVRGTQGLFDDGVLLGGLLDRYDIGFEP